MAAILALLKFLGCPLKKISIGTTIYVAEDRSSNLANLISTISTGTRVYMSDPHLARSSHPGLQSFARGFVKEGVGAGGVSIIAMIKSEGRIDGNKLLKTTEQEYESIINRVS